MKVDLKNKNFYLIFSKEEIETILTNSIKEVQEYKQIIDYLWETDEGVAWHLSDYNYRQLNFGVQVFLNKIQKVCPELEGFKLDVTKIRVNKNFEDLVIRHDKEVIKIMNPEYSERGIEKEYTFIYLNYSFSINDKLDDFVIEIDKDVYREV